jgi:predicted ATPase/DNA-binding SARP family transcriptional activator
MARLHLYLLGPMLVTLDDEQNIEPPYSKVGALLAYLAVERGQPQSRERLVGLLWPEQPERAARHSLSQALWNLRRSLHERDSEPPWILPRHDSVQFNPASDYWLDVETFVQLLDACDSHRHANIASCPACVERLDQAVALYRGPFLDGLSVDDSPEFDQWLVTYRESFERRLHSALSELLEHYESLGQLARASEIAAKLIELEPWDEPSLRRLMGLLVASGQRSAALRRFERWRKALASDLALEPEAETVDLYQRIRDGVASSSPLALRGSSQQFDSHLPAGVSTFVGREREIAEITALLVGGDRRLITLTGAGGVGKTELAIKIAEAAGPLVADSVYFVPLAGLSSAKWLPSTILHALSLPVEGPTDARGSLFRLLKDRRALLVLDNFDHVVDGAVLVSELLDHAPGIRVLVTSRERLNLSSEWTYEVAGLGLPPDDVPINIEAAEAARLFLLNARKHRSGFVPWLVDWTAIARVCRLTSGMPLALELAAAWIPVLTCDEIANEIEGSLDFLSSSMRDVPERHRSMRTVFDRSWELLTEIEQRAFRRLSIFRGGFGRAAADAVTGTSLPVLSALVAKSLVRRDATGRYEIHELLRQYGEDRLRETELEREVVLERHRDYFIGFLADREAQLESREQESALKEIEAEFANLRAAWQRAVEQRDVTSLSRAAHGFWLFHEITGRYQEGDAAITEAVTALDAVREPPSDDEDDHYLALARLLMHGSALSFRLGRNEDMFDLLDRSMAILRRLDSLGDLALALNFKAVWAQAHHEHALEEAALQESIRLARDADHHWVLAYSLNDLGKMRILAGDYAEATRLHEESLSIFERLGDRRGAAFALRDLGLVSYRQGDTGRARRLLQRSLDLRRAIGNLWGIGESLLQFGVVLRESGSTDEARDCFLQALQVATEIYSMPLVSEILIELVSLMMADNQIEPALSALSAIARNPASSTSARERAERTLRRAGVEHDGEASPAGASDAERDLVAIASNLLSGATIDGAEGATASPNIASGESPPAD